MSREQRGHFEIAMGTGDLVWVAAGIRDPKFEDEMTMNTGPATEETVKDDMALGSPNKTET